MFMGIARHTNSAADVRNRPHNPQTPIEIFVLTISKELLSAYLHLVPYHVVPYHVDSTCTSVFDLFAAFCN
jgi:hypothetical protein